MSKVLTFHNCYKTKRRWEVFWNPNAKPRLSVRCYAWRGNMVKVLLTQTPCHDEIEARKIFERKVEAAYESH